MLILGVHISKEISETFITIPELETEELKLPLYEETEDFWDRPLPRKLTRIDSGWGDRPPLRRLVPQSDESSSSSSNLQHIHFRPRQASVGSRVDTSSAPVSFVNDFNDSNDSIGGIFSPAEFRNISIQTSNRQSTPVPDTTTQVTQPETRADLELTFKSWGVSYEVRSSVDQRKPCCIFCCCICFNCFSLSNSSS